MSWLAPAASLPCDSESTYAFQLRAFRSGSRVTQSGLTVTYTISIVTCVKGAELRQIRKRLGLTQDKLAALVGVAANTIARQERGEMGIKEPLARLLRLLAKQRGRSAPGQKAR